MKNIVNHLRRLDWVLIVDVFLLISLGLIFIYYVALSRDNFLNFKKQLIFFGIGLFLMFAVSFFDWRVLREDPFLILTLYFLCFLSLIGLLFFAAPTHGVKAWYRIGLISIDPIEFTKIVLIILLAKYFSLRHIEVYRTKHIILSGIYVFLPSFLIFLQPNLGSALILIAIWIGILIISGIKLRHFLVLCLCGLLVLILSWSFLLKDYQKERIFSFINPQIDPRGISWNVNQSKIAIGSGGLLGMGVGKGFQTRYGFLPAPETDFIFAAIAEETGLIGVSILFLLFIVLIWRILRVAFEAKSNFPRLFASGLAILLISHFFINIGMNLGLLPIIGIPLPLVSYGGSNLISLCIGLGILQNIRRSLLPV